MTITAWELWACAHQVMQQHGDQALQFVAGRIDALTLAGDRAGVQTWHAIAGRIADLQAAPLQPLQ